MSEMMIKVHATKPGYLSIVMYDGNGRYLGESLLDSNRAKHFADLLYAQATIAKGLKDDVDIALSRDRMFRSQYEEAR